MASERLKSVSNVVIHDVIHDVIRSVVVYPKASIRRPAAESVRVILQFEMTTNRSGKMGSMFEGNGRKSAVNLEASTVPQD